MLCQEVGAILTSCFTEGTFMMMLLDEIQEFLQGLFNMKKPMLVWTIWIVVINLFSLAFLPRPEAIAVLTGFILSSATMFWLAEVKGFVRLLGAAYLWWIPVLIYLTTRLGSIDVSTFGIWLVVLFITNLIALVFDVIDVIKYFRGQDDEMIVHPLVDIELTENHPEV